MHTLKLNIDGKTKYMPIQLTPEQEQQVDLYLAATQDAKIDYTGWEKPEPGEYCYFEGEDGEVAHVLYDKENEDFVDHLYDRVKCFSHAAIAAHAIRVQVLLRQLRRFAATNRVKPYNEKEGGYTIMYNYVDECIEIGHSGPYLALGDILFDTEELAQEAITHFREELIWYFTNTKERLWTN